MSLHPTSHDRRVLPPSRRLLRSWQRSGSHSDRLWDFGARTFTDLDRIVLPAGQEFSLGKDIHIFRDKAAEKRALHPADRENIEALLRACGSPGGALDVMVRHAGTPLSEGGGVLEKATPAHAKARNSKPLFAAATPPEDP